LRQQKGQKLRPEAFLQRAFVNGCGNRGGAIQPFVGIPAEQQRHLVLMPCCETLSRLFGKNCTVQIGRRPPVLLEQVFGTELAQVAKVRRPESFTQLRSKSFRCRFGSQWVDHAAFGDATLERSLGQR
jgi:hypothetical protein